MKSFIIFSTLITFAVAQSSSSLSSSGVATPSSTANPLIPTSISSGCSSFLTSLNSDDSLSPCTSALISATSGFGPTANSSSPPSTSTISTALNNLCGTASSSCSSSTVRGKLADFYSSCSAELTNNPNDDVLRMYDVLYALIPLQQAACSKDDSGRYCVTEISSANGTSSSAPGPSGVAQNFVESNAKPVPGDVQRYLYSTTGSLSKRATNSSTQSPALVPNTTTFASSNLLFMFLQPSSPQSSLCTTCTRSILTAYINFESNVPYAPGLSKSPLLCGQSAIYSAVQNTCGTNFLSGAVQAAGGLGSGLLGNGAAGRAVAANSAVAVSTMLGVVALGFAVFL